MSKIPAYICFALCCAILCLQVSAQSERGTTIEDFNKDGIGDTLTLQYDGGSGFGGTEARLTNGRTGEVFSMNTDGCFCDFKRFVLVPSMLRKPENVAFLEAIKSELLAPCRKQADPSLEWMIRGSYSHASCEDNAIFDLLIDPQLEWLTGTPEVPENYCIELKGDSLRKLYTSPFEWEIEENDVENGAFLLYLAHNHYENFPIREKEKPFAFAAENELYKIEMTRHGLLASSQDGYKWIFISDAFLSGAPDKLRWASISKVWLKDHYVILQQTLPTSDRDRLFVIEIESGFCARLKGTCLQYELKEEGTPFKREEGLFEVETDEGIQILDWSDVKREFENQMAILRAAEKQ